MRPKVATGQKIKDNKASNPLVCGTGSHAGHSGGGMQPPMPQCLVVQLGHVREVCGGSKGPTSPRAPSELL